MRSVEIRRFALHEASNLPEKLWQVPSPPFELFIQGKPEAFALLEQLPRYGFAVVGTRRPQQRSLTWTREVISHLRKSDLIILSGLALGIDACAHEAALDAGLPTIAFLGTGLNYMYPSENLSLRNRILEQGGLIVSEFPLDSTGASKSFIRRNRLIAGWSLATWMVEASFRSGALNTISWARLMGRHCYVTPSFPGDPAFTGNQKVWLQHHMTPDPVLRLIWTPDDLLNTWTEMGSHVAIHRSRLRLVQGSDHCRELVSRVNSLSRQQGCASVEQLLQWTLEQGWTPLEFYSALQEALDERLLADSNGLLVSVS